jgi:hypothetical protein
MTAFERTWYEKYMANMVALATLDKLVQAGKLTREAVDAWAAERVEVYGV